MRRVEPSMSVNTNVTVPDGNLDPPATICIAFHAPCGRRAQNRVSRMGDRLHGRVVVVVGGGQTPGETIGNGRAAAIVYAREGARVVVVDRVLMSAEDTVSMIRDEGGEAIAHVADITDAKSC